LLVGCLGCPEEQRAEWEWLVSEKKKYGMVVVSKKDFKALSKDIKKPYKEFMKQVGLSRSPDKYDLLATDALIESLNDTGTLFILKSYDARKAVLLV